MGIALPGRFREVWLGDFEFHAPPGERPRPVCAVFQEFKTGRTLRFWQDELHAMRAAPFSTGADVLFVSYYASAELSCFLALGWPVPARVLDLFAEFRALNNGLSVPCGHGLLGALVAHGLDAMSANEKQQGRELVMRGGPWSDEERRQIITYCEQDVLALAELLPAMLPQILGNDTHSGRALSQALHRGRYMKAVARMEWTGTPIDTCTLARLRGSWESIKLGLIDAVDSTYDVYEGGSFVMAKFEAYLIRNDIPWPRLESGTLALDDDSFRQMARAFPRVSALRELRYALSKLRLNELAVGADGRNRVLVSAYRAKSGRNQPSASKFIFGPSVWLRGLIKPAPGYGLALIDWSSQEYGIAAALSGDEKMMAAYRGGDVYLAFAEQAGLVSPGASAEPRKAARSRAKALTLGLQYGMTAEGLAVRLGVPTVEARHLVQLHHQAYPVFWTWIERVVNSAMMGETLRTVFNWPLHVDASTKLRTVQNFPMQANGAEMLRLACCKGTEAGISVCAPVHDAILIEAPLDQLEQRIAEMREHMAEASKAVLSGFEVQTSYSTVHYPERYMDEERGRAMWDRVMRLLDAEAVAAGLTDTVAGQVVAHQPPDVLHGRQVRGGIRP
jgi:DNA polymerase-1